jgi:LuxR family transcriptional regulator, quorum-sensing system regulator BjaR1
VESLAELDLVLGRCIAEIGFDTFVGVNVLDPGGRPNHQVLFGRTHHEWEERYASQGYDAHDAVLREIMGGGQPLFWSDVTRRRPLEMDEIRLYNEASEFRLNEGFLTPIHNLDGSLSAVLLIGEKVDAAAPDVRAAAHMLSLYYGALGAKFHRAEQAARNTPVPLSARQKECLHWVRQGKSSTDIGDLLGLSGRTVDHYIADACRRLGVRTRVQAVVEASMRSGLAL